VQPRTEAFIVQLSLHRGINLCRSTGCSKT